MFRSSPTFVSVVARLSNSPLASFVLSAAAGWLAGLACELLSVCVCLCVCVNGPTTERCVGCAAAAAGREREREREEPGAGQEVRRSPCVVGRCEFG